MSTVLVLASILLATDGLSERDFQSVFEITAQNEAWESIPWQTDILEARRQAAIQGKPLFIWSMNGNPLGCT